MSAYYIVQTRRKTSAKWGNYLRSISCSEAVAIKKYCQRKWGWWHRADEYFLRTDKFESACKAGLVRVVQCSVIVNDDFLRDLKKAMDFEYGKEESAATKS